MQDRATVVLGDLKDLIHFLINQQICWGMFRYFQKVTWVIASRWKGLDNKVCIHFSMSESFLNTELCSSCTLGKKKKKGITTKPACRLVVFPYLQNGRRSTAGCQEATPERKFLSITFHKYSLVSQEKYFEWKECLTNGFTWCIKLARITKIILLEICCLRSERE